MPSPVSDEVKITSGNAAMRLRRISPSVSGDHSRSRADSLDLVLLGQHDLVGHRRFVEDCRTSR